MYVYKGKVSHGDEDEETEAATMVKKTHSLHTHSLTDESITLCWRNVVTFRTVMQKVGMGHIFTVGQALLFSILLISI